MNPISMHERFPLQVRPVEIGGRVFPLLHLPNVDRLLDELIAKGPDHPDVRDEKLPYWAEIWPSSIALAAAIVEDPAKVKGKAVVELGCGPGLAGLVALDSGAADVVFTDWMPEALELASLNVSSLLHRQARTRLVDWRNPPGDLKADVVLASDCTYEARFFSDVYRCFRTLLAPGGQVLLSEPGRSVAKGFFAMAGAEGFVAAPLVSFDLGAVWLFTRT